MAKFSTDGVLERLEQLDGDIAALFGLGRRFEIVIVGGSALMVMGLVPDGRFTVDIHVLKTASEIGSLLERYDMNTDVSTFLYQYPEGWERRRVKVPFDGMCLDVYTLSNEDLAITKLLAWRPADRQDLLSMVQAGTVDIEALQAILDDMLEVRINLEETQWEELLDRLRVMKDWSQA